MKDHLKKYGTTYLVILSIIFFILSCVLIYFGRQMKKPRYTKEEAIGIMKLQADQLTRMIEISSNEGSCNNSNPITLSEEQMEKYGFEKNLYEKIVYTMKCENEKQIVMISITGTGNFKGYKLTNYVSNQKNDN